MSDDLFVNLTGIKGEQSDISYPATSACKQLLISLGRDVCAFRRNTWTAYRVVEHVRLVYDGIHHLIDEVEQYENYDAFDAYTSAIQPLEELLFSLVDTAHTETDQDIAVCRSVESLVAFIELWDVNRSKLRGALEKLRHDDVFQRVVERTTLIETDEEVEAACSYDDTKLLAGFVRLVQDNPISGSPSNKHMVQTIDELKAIEIRLISARTRPLDAIVVYIIKVSMLIYGTSLLSTSGHMSDLWNVHAKSQAVWEVALRMVQQTRSLLGGVLSVGSEEMDAAYNGYILALRNSPAVALPENFVKLLRFAGRIGRAHHSQALYLVRLCRELADHFEQIPQPTDTNWKMLQLVFDSALKTLNSAADASHASAASYGIVPHEANQGAVLFDTVQHDIEQCFAAFNLGSVWPDRLENLKLCAIKDKERTDQFELIIGQVQSSVTPMDTRTFITVNIEICKNGSSGTVLHTLRYVVRPTTRLTAIQWQAGKDLNLSSTTVVSSGFALKIQPTQRLELARDMRSLCKADSSCDLVLFVD